MPAYLRDRCIAAVSDGSNFPTIWHTIIRHSPLVKGPPVQAGPSQLEIPLITGQRLVYNSEKKDFSLI